MTIIKSTTSFMAAYLSLPPDKKLMQNLHIRKPIKRLELRYSKGLSTINSSWRENEALAINSQFSFHQKGHRKQVTP
jgi:hypothetical protein